MLSMQRRHGEAGRGGDARGSSIRSVCGLDHGAWVRYVAGDFAAAIDECRNALDMDPEFIPAGRVLAAAYLQTGRDTEALSSLEYKASLTDVDYDPLLLAWLAHAKAVLGHRRDAVALNLADTRPRTRALRSAVPTALAYVGLKHRRRVRDARSGVARSRPHSPRLPSNRGSNRYRKTIINPQEKAAEDQFAESAHPIEPSWAGFGRRSRQRGRPG